MSRFRVARRLSGHGSGYQLDMHMAPGPAAYRHGVGDLMTTTMQPRRIKIAVAGREKNWILAAYEVHELDEAFDRLSIQWPRWQGLGMVLRPTHDGLQCCHRAAKREFVTIREPKENIFPDQDFHPKP